MLALYADHHHWWRPLDWSRNVWFIDKSNCPIFSLILLVPEISLYHSMFFSISYLMGWVPCLHTVQLYPPSSSLPHSPSLSLLIAFTRYTCTNGEKGDTGSKGFPGPSWDPGHKGETGLEKCDPRLLWQQQIIVSEQVCHQMLTDITQLRVGGVRAGLICLTYSVVKRKRQPLDSAT